MIVLLRHTMLGADGVRRVVAFRQLGFRAAESGESCFFLLDLCRLSDACTSFFSRRQPDLTEHVPPNLIKEGMIHSLSGRPALIAVVHQQFVEEIHSLGFKERQ